MQVTQATMSDFINSYILFVMFGLLCLGYITVLLVAFSPYIAATYLIFKIALKI